ncbi:hypothetical protein M2138_000774 [Dysgonomonadaceae bacterium PH5-43]|nr:hypothetical protein [Dysgonomonadaceae bacterium PH5-43]
MNYLGKNIRILYLFIFVVLASNCSSNKDYSNNYEINRFDRDLYNYLINPEAYPDFTTDYETFLKEYGENVLRIGDPNSDKFISNLRACFSDSSLMSIYKDELVKFENIDSINKELSIGLTKLFELFPNFKQPKVYMHISGLRHNVIVTDDILSISADKYMGADYPFYQNYFPAYQRQLMSPDRIVPDYLLGFLMANLPITIDNNDVLLDNMIYEGKLRYILSVLLPERNTWEYVAYDEEQYNWCMSNESEIWKSILENQHLYTTNYKITQQYLKTAPYTLPLHSESPGRVGVWVGFRIVEAYMKHNPKISMIDFVRNEDYKEILKQSKYKP